MKRITDKPVEGGDRKEVLRNVVHLYFNGKLQEELRDQTLKAIENANGDESLNEIRDGILAVIDCRYGVGSLTLWEAQMAYVSLGVDPTNLEPQTTTSQTRSKQTSTQRMSPPGH